MAGPKRQPRAEATRAHLLASARQVFSARGYQGASVAAITEAAATAHGTFYLYFRNKEDVFGEVMTEMLDELYRHSFTPFEELGDHYDPERNRERIAGFLRVFSADPGLWRALLEAVLASPAIEGRWLAQRERFHEGLADRLRRFQASGSLAPFDADEVARTLAGMLEWYAFTGVAFSSPRALSPREDVIDVLSALWMGAIANSAAVPSKVGGPLVGVEASASHEVPVPAGVDAPEGPVVLEERRSSAAGAGTGVPDLIGGPTPG